MNLTLIRGDSYLLTFALLDKAGNPYELTPLDKCYFTVKRKYSDVEYVLQRRLGEGISYNTETQLYEIRLTPSCTCDIDCGGYVYDIKVKIADEIAKTLVKGVLVLDSNVTHKVNEL